jgi:hypothetical protein
MREGGFDAALPLIDHFWQSTQTRPAGEVSVSAIGGSLWSMKKWRYALFGWVAWKVTKRVARRKLPLAHR